MMKKSQNKNQFLEISYEGLKNLIINEKILLVKNFAVNKMPYWRKLIKTAIYLRCFYRLSYKNYL